MSTVIHLNGLRLIVNSKESHHKGRPHCHAKGRGFEMVVDLVSLEVLHDTGFGPNDRKRIKKVVEHFRDDLMAKWEEYHGEERT